MFILLAHEMGHYLYARHYRVYATLPFFVPFPSLIGTLGAFIRIKSPIPSRAALFDIGIAGPIAGFIPACMPCWLVSLSQPMLMGSRFSSFNRIPAGFSFRGARAALARTLTALVAASDRRRRLGGNVCHCAQSVCRAGNSTGGHVVFSVLPHLHRGVSFRHGWH